ncbi:bifunctional molybdopterin-guanine dinucleotide biosynthesis adaptor protein MobB/molybdopterin molybdotransferase MoeA [Oceanospirillum sp.]|uniref:bifunctional molybdopterin-guanine dinucleotide biosynthesis adaptor protein MobB/molybdopterin molybdotransferase MoeA n=1 Tax=Oceanospirillum sp. TaxID=2021254 RepID=UPI003A8CEDD2
MVSELNPTPAAVSCFDQPGQLSVQQGRQALLDALVSAKHPDAIKQPIAELVGSVLAENVISPINVPAQTNAAMDGFALALPEDGCDSFPSEYQLVGKALAGHGFDGQLKTGQAVTITTGAPVPAGANSVVMREICQSGEGAVLIEKPESLRLNDNIRQAGEDLATGQIAVKAGTRLTPAHQGLIASLGLTDVAVFKPLVVAVFSTGDEVVAQGQPLPPHSIYDTNRYSLIALLKKLHCEVIDLGILPDQEAVLAKALADAAVKADVVISSGGVSVGVADYIKTALARVGEIGFWRMNIRPGRPFAFGCIGADLAQDNADSAWFFGLPGNPVAVMVTFMQLAQPALRQLQGETGWQLQAIPATASEKMRSREGRTDFHRGIFSLGTEGQLQVQTTGTQGSGILRSMTEANCLIEIGDEHGAIAAGDSVTIYPFADLL